MPFLDIFEAETPIRRVANVRQMNRIVNILMTMEGVGIRIERDNSREGRGWKLVLDEEVSRRITPAGENEGDILYYDATDNKWKAAGTAPTEGDILYYDGTQWAAMEIDTTEELDLAPHITVDNTDSANPRLKVSALKVKLEVSGGKLKLATGTRGADNYHSYGCPPKSE